MSSQSSEYISHMHPLNAEYLLHTEPHRLYGDAGGNTLELLVERFASTVAETLYGQGGVIAIAYHDVTTSGQLSSEDLLILRPDGQILRHSSLLSKEVPGALEIDIFYMILNSIRLNRWLPLDRDEVEREFSSAERETRDFAKFGMGMTLPIGSRERTGLKASADRLREKIIRGR